jgi:hypothetical protein
MPAKKPKIVSLNMGATVEVEIDGKIHRVTCSGTNTATKTPEQVQKNILDCIKKAGASRRKTRK